MIFDMGVTTSLGGGAADGRHSKQTGGIEVETSSNRLLTYRRIYTVVYFIYNTVYSILMCRS